VNVQAIVAFCAVATLTINLGGVVVAWWMLSTNQKLYLQGQEAIWAEVMVIKKWLGMTDGDSGKFASHEWQQDTALRLNDHSRRLKELELAAAERKGAS